MDNNLLHIWKMLKVLWLLETHFSPINELNLNAFQQLKPENEIKIPQPPKTENIP